MDGITRIFLKATAAFCVVPENILTHPKEGHRNSKREEVSEDQIFKEIMKLIWNFPEGWEGSIQKKLPWGRVWIFSGTTQLAKIITETG